MHRQFRQVAALHGGGEVIVYDRMHACLFIQNDEWLSNGSKNALKE